MTAPTQAKSTVHNRRRKLRPSSRGRRESEDEAARVETCAGFAPGVSDLPIEQLERPSTQPRISAPL